MRFDNDHFCASEADREASVGSGCDAGDRPVKAADDCTGLQLSKIAARGEQHLAAMEYEIIGRTRLQGGVGLLQSLISDAARRPSVAP